MSNCWHFDIVKNLTIRGIFDELHALLKKRAMENRRSLNQQVIAQLVVGLEDGEEKTKVGKAGEMKALVDRLREDLPVFATAEEIDEAKQYGRR